MSVCLWASIMIEFFNLFADCNESGMACLPLQDCPQVNEIALKIQQLGDFQADKKIELLNLINDKLCGGRINKHLLVCCDKVEVPSSVSDNNYRGYVCIYIFFHQQPEYTFTVCRSLCTTHTSYLLLRAILGTAKYIHSVNNVDDIMSH